MFLDPQLAGNWAAIVADFMNAESALPGSLWPLEGQDAHVVCYSIEKIDRTAHGTCDAAGGVEIEVARVDQVNPEPLSSVGCPIPSTPQMRMR